jgi:general secretion pathway protein G
MFPNGTNFRVCQRGSGWFEFAVVAVLLAILAGLLLRWVVEYQERAEKTVVELTLRNLRSALRWQVGQRMIHGGAADLAQLAGANPVAWLDRPPPGYLGELAGPANERSGGGNWYFDNAAGELAYVPNLSAHLAVHRRGAGELRWQLRALKFSTGTDVNSAVTEIVLVETVPYRWF